MKIQLATQPHGPQAERGSVSLGAFSAEQPQPQQAQPNSPLPGHSTGQATRHRHGPRGSPLSPGGAGGTSRARQELTGVAGAGEPSGCSWAVLVAGHLMGAARGGHRASPRTPGHLAAPRGAPTPWGRARVSHTSPSPSSHGAQCIGRSPDNVLQHCCELPSLHGPAPSHLTGTPVPHPTGEHPKGFLRNANRAARLLPASCMALVLLSMEKRLIAPARINYVLFP